MCVREKSGKAAQGRRNVGGKARPTYLGKYRVIGRRGEGALFHANSRESPMVSVIAPKYSVLYRSIFIVHDLLSPERSRAAITTHILQSRKVLLDRDQVQFI